MTISKTELYELIEMQAGKLSQLEITKGKAKDGFLLDQTIENGLRESGLNGLVEEMNSNNGVVVDKIQSYIEKEELVLFNLVDQLKFGKAVKTGRGVKK